MDTINRLLTREGRDLTLRRKVFDTLLVLIERSGQVIDKDEMMSLLWPDSFVEESNLLVNISALRKALAESGGQEYIETIPGRGYRFTAPVTKGEGDVARGNAGQGSSTGRRLRTVAGTAESDSLLEQRSKSIAVLPFKPLNPAVGDEYLGLGLADSLITRLSGINRLVVRPTSAISKYADSGEDMVAAGREQNVDAVLEGSIYRSGDRIRVTARLINIADSASLWGYRCDEDWTDIFKMEDSISERIAVSLLKSLSPDEQMRLTKRYTSSSESYHLYLKGRYYWNKFTGETLQKAIEYFNRAVEEDPCYALAYCGLADSYSALGVNYLAPKDSFPKAKAAALRALEIDETLAEAHVSLAGEKLLYEWDWPGAERELNRALDLNTGYATLYEAYGYYLQAMGRVGEAIDRLEQAQELDPLSSVITSDLAWAYISARQYDRALDQGLKALEMDPNFAIAHSIIGMAYEHKGEHKKAITALARASTLSKESPRVLALLGYAHAKAGDTAKAQGVLDRLTRLSKQRHMDPYNIAVARLGFGENEQAFECLEHAYKERSAQLIWLKLDPIFDSLRLNPRFEEFLRRMGL